MLYQVEGCVAAVWQLTEDFPKEFRSKRKNNFVWIQLFVSFTMKDNIHWLTLKNNYGLCSFDVLFMVQEKSVFLVFQVLLQMLM
jgi:hypothetical protein